jgi:mono/diheme cytochrome c family protein
VALIALLLVPSACEPPGKPEAEPPPALDVTDFKVLYSQNCSGCHGDNGKNGPGRILNDPLYLAYVQKEALHQVIENGRPGTAMPAWALKQGGPLTPKQVDALVDGLEGWKKAFRPGLAPLPAYLSTGPADQAKGKKLFLRGCFACHGPGARVGLVTDPSYLSLSTDQNLRTSIVVGRPDLGMPDYRFLNAGHALTDQDVSDLVAYLASLRPVDSDMGQREQKLTKNGEGTQ